jgi:hypothetical protein
MRQPTRHFSRFPLPLNMFISPGASTQQVVGVKKSHDHRKVGVKCSVATFKPVKWGSGGHLDSMVSKHLHIPFGISQFKKVKIRQKMPRNGPNTHLNISKCLGFHDCSSYMKFTLAAEAKPHFQPRAESSSEIVRDVNTFDRTSINMADLISSRAMQGSVLC